MRLEHRHVEAPNHNHLLDQNRGAQLVKDRAKAKERAALLNDSSATLVAVTTKSIKGFPRGRPPAATTSTKPPARLGYIFLGAPGPLPSIYGTILSGGRG